MVTLIAPNAPATRKQKNYLQQLTGKDTANVKLSMQEASDLIERLELAKLAEKKKQFTKLTSNGKSPYTEAHVTYIVGSQGGGKSVTAVARLKDKYDKIAVKIFCKKVLKINPIVKDYDRQTRIAKIVHNGQRRLIRIPDNYDLFAPMRDFEHSPMRIFSNCHLYGMVYKYIPSFRHLARWLKNGTIHDCWLMLDEYYMGAGARSCMSVLGKELSNQSQQFRKGQMDVIIISPISKLTDWTSRLLPTEQIDVSFNKTTGIVTLEIKKKGVKGTKTVKFDSRPYRKYYWTNERINE
jgi:hypothetical protein